MINSLRPAIVAVALSGATLIAASTLVAQHIAADLTGIWNFKVVTENGTGTPTVTIKQQGDSISGTYESGRMGILPFKGTTKGNTFVFAVSTSGGATLTFNGTIVDNDNVAGNVDFGGQGSATFTGERKK